MNEEYIKQRVDVMVDKIRIIWFILMVVASVVVLNIGISVWWLLAVFLVGFLGYQFSLVVGAATLVSEIMETGPVEPSHTEVVIKQVSGDIVGRYHDFDVPEWVDVQVGDVEYRFVFEDFAPFQNGQFVLPEEGGKIFFRGAYFQPAQSA